MYLFRRELLLILSIFVAACAYRPGNTSVESIDNPVVRKVAWYSYLDGGDIRSTCAEGSPDRYRLVYNGQYEKQLRAYEVNAMAEGGANLTSRVVNGQGIANWTILAPEDVFDPWTWKKSEIFLNHVDFTAFRALLTESGFGAEAPKGLRLYSRDFYWVAAGCENGQFHFFAWVDARGDFTRVKFADFLLVRDQTGLAFRKPEPVRNFDRSRHVNRNNDDIEPIFVLKVGKNGLSGLTNF